MDCYPGDPSESGAQGEQGLSDILRDPAFGRTHLGNEPETEMDLGENSGTELARLHDLLQAARSQLTAALEEANELQASWSGSEDDEGGSRDVPKNSDDLAEDLASLPSREREAAIKRARNREAARRSRQRKNKRINQLYKQIRSLQHENVVLLKCIEEFAHKAMTSKVAQLQMQQELEALAATAGHPAGAPTEPPASGTVPTTSGLWSKGSPKGTVSIPALEDLHKLQNAEPAQLTARSGTLSARAAVAEHMAMLSRDHSPRDEDDAVAGAGAGAGAGAAAGIAVAPTTCGTAGASTGNKDGAAMVSVDALMQQQIPMDTTATHAVHAMVPRPDGLIDVDELFSKQWGSRPS